MSCSKEKGQRTNHFFRYNIHVMPHGIICELVEKLILWVGKPQKKLSEIADNRVLFLAGEDVVFNDFMC